MNQRKLVLFIGMSLDGFIATKDDDLTWLDSIDHGDDDYGYYEMCKSTDSYIIGRKTYDVVMKLTGGKFPQAEQFDCYVITRQERAPENGITYYNGDIEALIQKLKQGEGKNIYCDGGGELVKTLMEKDLIDEYIISVLPIVLGDGKRLFVGGIDSIKLELKETKSFKSGMAQLRYTRKK